MQYNSKNSGPIHPATSSAPADNPGTSVTNQCLASRSSVFDLDKRTAQA
jgi:hypothetical protein